MLFMAIGQLKAKGSSDGWARRPLALTPPAGVTVIGEYWTGDSNARVVLVFEASSGFEWHHVATDWEDHVSFTITPAIDARAERGASASTEKPSATAGLIESLGASRPVQSPAANQGMRSDANLALTGSPDGSHVPVMVHPATTTHRDDRWGPQFSASVRPVRQAMEHVEPLTAADLTHRHGERTTLREPSCVLTRRECEILDRLSEGRSNREIALDLYISVRTVERHIANLYSKLGVHSRAEVIVWSYKRQRLGQTA